MKIPTSTENFLEEFFHSIDLLNTLGDLRIRQFIVRLNNTSDEIIASGVIEVFKNKDRSKTLYIDQKYAGKILEQFNPESDLELGTILKSTIENWNKSVPEFPFWLRKNYGSDTLRKEIIQLETQQLTDVELDKLKTLKWWLKI